MRSAVGLTATICSCTDNTAASRGWKLAAGQRVVVTGNLPMLGNWQPGHCLSLTEVCTPFWTVEVCSSAPPEAQSDLYSKAMCHFTSLERGQRGSFLLCFLAPAMQSRALQHKHRLCTRSIVESAPVGLTYQATASLRKFSSRPRTASSDSTEHQTEILSCRASCTYRSHG